MWFGIFMSGLRKKARPGIAAGSELRLSGMDGSRLFGRDRQFGVDRVVGSVCIFGEERRQFAIGGIALRFASLGITEPRRAHRLGEPGRVLEKPLRLARHVDRKSTRLNSSH